MNRAFYARSSILVAILQLVAKHNAAPGNGLRPIFCGRMLPHGRALLQAVALLVELTKSDRIEIRDKAIEIALNNIIVTTFSVEVS